MAQKPVTPASPSDDPWDVKRIEAHAPNGKAVRDARQLRKAGALTAVEPTADGRGWCARCRDATRNYQVAVNWAGDNKLDSQCNCPVYNGPCRHALALLLHLAGHPELRTEAEPPKTTAGDFEALLRAVFTNPADDTPRLVFADFLDENDQPDRANLIRLQCEQARLRSNSNRYKELARVIDKLVPKVRKQTGVFPFAHRQTGMRYTFRRGFLHLDGRFAQLDMDAVPARFVNLFRDGWVEAVHADVYRGYEFQASWVPLMAHVAELDLSPNALGEHALLALVAATADARTTGRLVRVKVHKHDQPVFDQLMRADRGETVEYAARHDEYRYFDDLTPHALGVLSRAGRLSGAHSLFLEGALGEADVPTLLAADLSQLARLDLHDWRLSAAGAAALVRGLARPDVPLRELDLSVCRVEGVARAFTAANGPVQLEALILGEVLLSDADAVLLAAEANLPRLTSLEVRESPDLTAAGAAALLASPRFSGLNSLELGDTGVAVRELVPLLLGAPGRENLTFVVPYARGNCSVRGNEVVVEVHWYDGPDSAFFDGLVGCAGLKRATSFIGTGRDVRAPEISALAAAFDPVTLRCLALNYNALSADDTAALVRAFGGFALRELSLPRCDLPATGVAAVARSALMATVEKLDLAGSTLGKVGLAALLKMSAPMLKELVLTDCRVTVPEKKRLKARFGSRVKL